MTHDQLLRKIVNSWQDLLDSYAGLSDRDLLEPGVVGAWSVRDTHTSAAGSTPSTRR